jgi:predicted metal-dependent peptidase
MKHAPAATLVEALSRLATARARLVLERPFLGSLVLHLPLQAADAGWCPRVATDARYFHFNPEYIVCLSPAQLQFVLAHEALHCALGHFHRRGHRLKARWDTACDQATDWLLIEDGLKPPPGVQPKMAWRGLAAEEIYPLLPDTPMPPGFDRHLFEAVHAGGAGQENRQQANQAVTVPPSILPGGAGELVVRWQQRLAAAAQSVRLQGRLSQNWQRAVDALISPQLPWRSLLARYFAARQRDDYSWHRPARRESDMLLPRLSSESLDVVVALDTSGSIGETQLDEFLGEVDVLKSHVRARITLLACDETLAGPWVYDPWDSLSLPASLSGGGGTDFRPVFDWIGAQSRVPDLLVFFTDAEGTFPEAAPAWPVVWLVRGAASVPWGERIALN